MFPITINIVDQHQWKVPRLMERPKEVTFAERVILILV